MSPKAPTVKLIRYQWFVFKILLRFWLQYKRKARHAALKHVGSRHQKYQMKKGLAVMSKILQEFVQNQ